MREVYENVFVGSEADCQLGEGDLAVIHVCKYPCHKKAVGYAKSVSPNHPNYLFLERGQDLFLNIIDPEKPVGGEFQFMPENQRFDCVARDAAVPYASPLCAPRPGPNPVIPTALRL